ncbi:CRISPR system precrRNA processing endoribonuclease RAMP protein Cas6 [Roseospira navarrensis]|uniref:CRISPR system precrRNA processing endoribonuclease RAMP protein Cas6 n=1 Tax=Roseospira navarrensis TaxID=140058 RepID=A0A7X2D489_9PROT|nr:CRISPR system precrRNA processing endoribonuclease RAMP protein Cas6 [Roseospira navarrensis]MQX38169.1 CRISPR system precrRNA processing endoribonuclease RAMP protein Cas6 [Roseospira navarrensis]
MLDTPPTLLDQSLADPDRTVDASSLLEVWHQADIRFDCERPTGLDEPWRLPHRIRGAVGHQLRGSASPAARNGRPCPWTPPCAHDLLYRTRTVPDLRQPLATPWVIAAEAPDDTTVTVTNSLFGWAVDWIGEVAEAATQALNGHAPTPAAHRLRLPVRSRAITVLEGIPDPTAWPDDAPAVLDFRTPVLFRDGDRPHATLADLPLRLADRLEALAPWMGVRLRVKAAALQALAETLPRDESGLRPFAGMRRSHPQGRRVPVEGRVGPLLLGAPPPMLVPYLVLGQWTHVGSRAGLGQGRYSLRPLPR